MRGTTGSWLGAGLLAIAPVLSAAEPGGVRVNATAPPEVREWDVRIEQLAREGALQLERSEADTMLPGRRHQRLSQLHKGVKVEGGQLVRQVGDTGEVLSVFGTYFDGIGVDVVPAIGAAAARGAVQDRIGKDGPILTEPELTLTALDGGDFSLAYTLVAGGERGPSAVGAYSVPQRAKAAHRGLP